MSPFANSSWAEVLKAKGKGALGFSGTSAGIAE